MNKFIFTPTFTNIINSLFLDKFMTLFGQFNLDDLTRRHEPLVTRMSSKFILLTNAFPSGYKNVMGLIYFV